MLKTWFLTEYKTEVNFEKYLMSFEV